MISCKKIQGIELMFLIQVTYYSLIPLDVPLYPFNLLSSLRYSTGAVPMEFGDNSLSIPLKYSILNIQPNFLSNVSLSLIPVFFSLMLYFPIKLVGTYTRG